MRTEKVFFRNNKRKKLIGVIHVPDMKEGESLPCVIISHGITSSKDNKAVWANRLCIDGFVVLRFDLSGHGESEGKLENCSITQWADDLACAVKYVRSLDYVNENSVGLTGHSLGGSLSIICASKDKKIKAVSPVSPATDYKEIFEIFGKKGLIDSIKTWKKLGYTKLIFADRKKMKFMFYKDAIKYKFDKIAKKIKCPVLIIHGELDEIVPIDQSKNVIKYFNEPKKLVIMKDVKHNFTNPREFENMMQMTQKWFLEWMKNDQP